MGNIQLLMKAIALAEINLPSRPIFITLVVVGCVFFLLFAFTLILALTDFHKRRKKELQANLDYNVRIYSYDYTKGTLTSFDSINLLNKKEFTFEEFKEQFTAFDSHMVEAWLKEAKQSKDNTLERRFLQADIRVGHPAKVMTSMMEITEINKEMGIIHFTSKLLPDITPQTLIPGTANQATFFETIPLIPRNKRKYFFRNLNEAKKFLDNTDDNSLTAVFYLRFYRDSSAAMGTKTYELPKVKKAIEAQSLSTILEKTRRLLEINDTDEVIIDGDAVSKSRTISLATSISTLIQKFLNNNNITGVSFAIGVSIGNFNGENIDAAISHSASMADAITKKEIDYSASSGSKTPYLFYDPEFLLRVAKDKQDLLDINAVLRNATFRVFFTPTLDIRTGGVAFYFLDVRPYGTTLSDFDDLVRIVQKIPNGAKTLYQELSVKVNRIAQAKRKDIRIVVTLPSDQFPVFVRSIESDPHVEWILCVREMDIVNYFDKTRNLTSLFNEVTSRGYRIALEIANAASNMPQAAFHYASLFIVGTMITSKIKEDNRIASDLRLIQNNYAIGDRPIVYEGLSDYNGIELCAHYGGTVFECDALALKSSIPEELDTEKVNFLLDDVKNLLPRSPEETGTEETEEDPAELRRKTEVIS
jgi:hypothetical protein